MLFNLISFDLMLFHFNFIYFGADGVFVTRESLHCAADSRHPIFIRQTEAGVIQVSVFRSTTRIIKLKKYIYMKKKMYD